MKLLYVTAGLPFSRSEAFVIPEILELRRRGHDVVVAPVNPYRSVLHADAESLLQFTKAEPVLSARVALGGLAQAVRHPLRTAAAFGALLGSRNPHVLAKNFAVFPKGLWLAGVAAAAGVDHIHVHWASTSATAGLVAARLTGIPWSFTAHRWDIAENNLICEKARSASFARAIDVRGGEELRGHMGPFGGKLVVIHMGVELPGFDAREPAPVSGPLRVVMAAFFVEKKGHRFAVDAVAALRDRGVPIHLTFAGDGPLRAEIERQAAELHVSDRVTFLGMVSHGKLLEGLASGSWDAALLPSIVTGDGEKEGIPVFLMEAMAAGLPVVATDTGGIPELLANGAGLVIPERDPVAIADALERLHRDPGLRHELASSARRMVKEEFAVAGSVDRLLALFEGAATSAHAGAAAQPSPRA